MVLRLSDDIPLVWRTPTSAQLGVDRPVVIEDMTAGTERLLAALRAGVSHSGLHMLAQESGVPAPVAQTLLERLEPLLEAEPATVPVPAGCVLVTGRGPIASTLAGLLREGGMLAAPGEETPGLVVLVADWVIGPDDAARWLRRDIPHLPIVASDLTITVGPFVEPGIGPCIYCLQLAGRDADPAWPAIAAQLWGRPSPPHTQLDVLSAACFAARLIAGRLATGPGTVGRGWRLTDQGGTISAWTARTHPQCSCAALPETGWGPAPARAGRGVPTTG